jgi:hypothetical protein
MKTAVGVVLAAALWLVIACGPQPHSRHAGGYPVLPVSGAPGPVKTFLKLVTTGLSAPRQNDQAKAACRAADGDFVRDQSWAIPTPPAYKLYECDNVPYLAADGSIYQMNIRYDSVYQLTPQSAYAGVSHRQCVKGIYPQADTNPGSGIWSAQLGICMPTAAQISSNG